MPSLHWKKGEHLYLKDTGTLPKHIDLAQFPQVTVLTSYSLTHPSSAQLPALHQTQYKNSQA